MGRLAGKSRHPAFKRMANWAIGAQNLNSKPVLMHKGTLSWGSWKPLWHLPKPFFCLLLTGTDYVTHSLTGDHQVPSSISFCKPTEMFEVLPSTVIPSDGQVRWAFLPLQRWRSGQGALNVWGLHLSPQCPLNFHTIQLWLSNTTWQWYIKVSRQISELTLSCRERHHWTGERETLSSVWECAWQTEETSTNIQF